uniref:Uncharacterized protein n=1 Tax=Arundo donax TaxID=35708 RepID=A0A0A9HLQ2_ARUDO
MLLTFVKLRKANLKFVMQKLLNTSSLRNYVNSQAIAPVHTNIIIKALSQRSPDKNKTHIM